jgi:hypothetical protein
VHSQYALKDVSCSGATIADVRANQLSAVTSGEDPARPVPARGCRIPGSRARSARRLIAES